MLNCTARIVKFISLAILVCLPINSLWAEDDFEAYRRQQMEGAQQDKREYQEDKIQTQQKSNQITTPPVRTDEIKNTDSDTQEVSNSIKTNEPKVKQKQQPESSTDEFGKEIEAHQH